MRIIVINQANESHLNAVVDKMITLGAPTIKCVHVEGDLYYALEGSHRLFAAQRLGLQPELDIVELPPDLDGIMLSQFVELGEYQDDMLIDDIFCNVRNDDILTF